MAPTTAKLEVIRTSALGQLRRRRLLVKTRLVHSLESLVTWPRQLVMIFFFFVQLGDKVISRIVDLVGSRSNGVWSTQIEVEYKRKFKGEAGLPDKWTKALEAEAEKAAAASADGQQSNTAPPFPLRVDWPLPGVDRCIIYTNLKQVKLNTAASNGCSNSSHQKN